MKPVYANFFSINKGQKADGKTVEMTLHIGHKYMEQQAALGPGGAVQTVSTPVMDEVACLVLTPETARALRTLLDQTVDEL